MADRYSATFLDAFADPNTRATVTRYAEIDNDSISATDITDKVNKWGKIKTTIYNRHPGDRGGLDFPVLTLVVDNDSGLFTPGNAAGYFPNGFDDIDTTTVRVRVQVQVGLSIATPLDFTGNLRDPELPHDGLVSLTIEHPLAELKLRKWTKGDAVGGPIGSTFTSNT